MNTASANSATGLRHLSCLFAAAVSCASAPVKPSTAIQSHDSGPNAFVGPVALDELARVIAEMAFEGEQPRPLIPFLIVVHPLTVPTEPSRVRCTWGEAQIRQPGVGYRVEDMTLGHLQSYRVVSASDESREIGTWHKDNKMLAEDGGFRKAPDSYDVFRPSVDWDIVRDVVHYDEHLAGQPTSTNAIVRFGAVRAYHVALLCQEAGEAALFVDYVDGPLNGRGMLLVLRLVGGRWRLVAARETWVS